MEDSMRRTKPSKTFEKQRAALAEVDDNIVLFDGYEDALIGFVERFGESPVAVYDKNKCLKILESDGMTPKEAREWFDCNTIGAYTGPQTPVFLTFLKDLE
jgi:hypothetical protein